MFVDCLKCYQCTQDGQIVSRICNDSSSVNYRRPVSPSDCDQCKSPSNAERAQHPASNAKPALDPNAYSPGVPRLDLAAIALTLPPDDGGKRNFQRPIFEADGALTYPKKEGDWEPPRVPDGYVVDENDAWHLLPLWLPCSLRHQSAYINGNCGCVMIVMRCNNPAAKTYRQRVACDTCETCKLRRTS